MADTLERKPEDRQDDALNPVNRSLANAEKDASNNPVEDKLDDSSSTPDGSATDSLVNRETAATGGSGAVQNTKSGTEASADDMVGEKGYTGDGKGKKGFRAKLRNMSKPRKYMLIGAATGGGGLIGIIIFLFILASSLNIPNLMQNITAYQFARLSRQYAKSADRITTEKLATDALDDNSWKKLVQTKYQNLRDNTLGKFDKYRPSQVMKNLSSEHGFKATYTRTALGREQLIGVTLGDQTFLRTEQSAATRFVPILSSVLDTKNDAGIAKQLSPALQGSLRAQDIGPITRFRVASQIRKELGISLVAWHLDKFQGKDERAARLEEARQKAKIIDNQPVNDNSVTDRNKNAVSDAEQAAENTVNDDKALQEAIDNGGTSKSVKTAIASALQTSQLDTLVGALNSFYAVAMPACIVYDGSMNSSGPTINHQVGQQIAAWQYGASAADQQKAGSQDTDPQSATELATAIRATNDDIGDTSNTYAMQIASTGTVDTSSSLSAEASAGGEFTLLNATPGIPDAVASTINAAADSVCPYITNIWGATALGLAQLGITFFTGGAAKAGADTAGEAAKVVITRTSDNIAKRILSKTTAKLGRVKDILVDTGKSTAKIVAATVVAKLIVNQRAGTINGGLTQGQPLADEMYCGGGEMSGMLEQRQMYGRPLLPSEVAQSDQADRVTVAAANSSKSMYERYLATDNSQSLLNRMAIDVRANSNGSIVHSLMDMAATAFRPTAMAGALAGVLNPNASAATNAYDQHCGTVQFGWSEDEENLIDSREDYRSHLENQAVLDASNQQDAIASHYGDCFTKNIGDLLSSGEIVLDSDGKVIADQGLCSPNNLGPNNSDPDSPCGASGCGDLVFRYRIAESSDNTVDQLTDDQTVTETSATNDNAPSAQATNQKDDVPTIVIDPGHSGQTISDIDPETGLKDYDYANHPEMEDVFDVAQLVNKKLTADGYKVLMTKKSASDSVSFRNRADIANNANADLAVSIHDEAGTKGVQFSQGNNIVYDQAVGDYRSTSAGKKILFADSAIAATSQKYGQIFQQQRQIAQGTKVTLQDNTGYDLGGRGLAAGNIWMVQLFSKVPWIYNEAGGNSAGQTGLNSTDKQTYANGLVAAIEKSVPIQ